MYDWGKGEIKRIGFRRRMEGGSVSRLICSGTVHVRLLGSYHFFFLV